tara:strand:+ start:2971 stop:3447 length:477 start_codon:yes stop_codon:yes gene_type:complete
MKLINISIIIQGTKQMKKYLLLSTLILFMSGCATLHSNKYSQITLDNVQKKCQSDESWQLNLLGLTAHVIVLEECLGVKKLLVIAIDADEKSKEARQHSLKLIELRYIEFTNNRDGKNQTLRWSIKKIKGQSGNGWHNHFYELTSKKLECSGPTCKRN